MPLSYARDIRLLFTREDIECMDFAFDLGNYDEVAAEAEAIYARLADKSMPPDDPWSDGHIAQFRQWIDEGMNP
jgi:hypothetical protein